MKIRLGVIAIVQTLVLRLVLGLGVCFVLGLGLGAANAEAMDVVVSVPEQKLFVFNEEGERVASYRISTSAHGLGDGRGTYATPLGKLEVASKIGAGAPIGTVFKAGRRTGEICAVNAKGRDPIVTRILHLRGLEQHNAHAYGRCIYIHGTPDERRLGQPVSYGCIRMASKDVAELFDLVNVGTRIEITQERVSGMFGNMARRSTTSPTMAVAAPTPSVPTRSAAVGQVTSGVNSAMVALSAKHAAPEPKVTRASGASIRLLETSGLTINFGGDSERSDRPR